MILAYHFLPNQDLTQTQHNAHISMDSLKNPFIKLKQVVQLFFCCTLPHTFKYYKVLFMLLSFLYMAQILVVMVYIQFALFMFHLHKVCHIKTNQKLFPLIQYLFINHYILYILTSSLIIFNHLNHQIN